MSTGNNSTKLTVTQLSDIMSQRCGAIEHALMALAQGFETFKTETLASFAAITEQMKERITAEAHQVPSEVTEAKLAELSKPATPAPAVAAAIADDALSSVSDADLRKFYAACGQELKRRNHGTTGSTKTAERQTARIEYKAKKSEYESRPFGVICPSKPADKQLLRRRFTDYAEAERQAAELRASMKRDYRVIPLTH
jgi:hypothetical protein